MVDTTFPLIQVPYPHPTRPEHRVTVKIWHRGAWPVTSPRALIRKLAGRRHLFLPGGTWTLGGHVQPTLAVDPTGVHVEIEGLPGALRIGSGAPGEPIYDALTLIVAADALTFDRAAVSLLLDVAERLPPLLQQAIRRKPGPQSELEEHIAGLRHAYVSYRVEGLAAASIQHAHVAYRAEKAAQGEDTALDTLDPNATAYAASLARNSARRMEPTTYRWKALRRTWEADFIKQTARAKHQ